MLKRRLAVFGVLLAAGLVAWGQAATAKQGDTRTTFFVSSASLTAGDDTTIGSIFGGGWGVEIQDQLLWSISASHTSTEGDRTVNGQNVPLTASSTNLQTGLTVFFNPGSRFVPFTGGGLSVAAYDIDFAYQNSEIGKTSGTGGGVFGRLGLEVRLGAGFTLIPQINFSIHSIRSDQGASKSLLSDGVGLAIRISV